jgi:uncharacterized protein (DUF1697 family)
MQGEALGPYVALLRGVKSRFSQQVAMANLRALFEGLGYDDVATYVQSGNVVFKSRGGNAAQLTSAIERRIERELGLSIAIVLRSRAQLARIAAGNPFVKPPFSRSSSASRRRRETGGRLRSWPSWPRPDELRPLRGPRS